MLSDPAEQARVTGWLDEMSEAEVKMLLGNLVHRHIDLRFQSIQTLEQNDREFEEIYQKLKHSEK